MLACLIRASVTKSTITVDATTTVDLTTSHGPEKANQGRRLNHYWQSGKVSLAFIMVLALVAASAGVWFGQWQQSKNAPTRVDLDQLQEKLTNTLLFPEDYKTLPAFNLIDENSTQVDQSSFDGKWSMVFFGFTRCPDICPITLAVLRDTLNLMTGGEQQPEPFEIVFVSVDPNRDTPEVLKPYLGSFNTDVRGITGDLTNILELTRELGIVVAYHADEDDPSQYSVDHTSSILLVGPDSRIRAKFNVPHEAETIVSDYSQVYSALAKKQPG